MWTVSLLSLLWMSLFFTSLVAFLLLRQVLAVQPVWPGTLYVAQYGINFTTLQPSASWVWTLKYCTTMDDPIIVFRPESILPIKVHLFFFQFSLINPLAITLINLSVHFTIRLPVNMSPVVSSRLLSLSQIKIDILISTIWLSIYLISPKELRTIWNVLDISTNHSFMWILSIYFFRISTNKEP